MSDRQRKLKDRASRLFSDGKLKDALKAYQEIVDEDPTEVACRLKVGDIHRRLGQRPQAVAAYEVVARHYAEDGLMLKAVAACKLILGVDPSHTKTQEMLAALYTQKEQPRGRGRPQEVEADRADSFAIDIEEDEGGAMEVLRNETRHSGTDGPAAQWPPPPPPPQWGAGSAPVIMGARVEQPPIVRGSKVEQEPAGRLEAPPAPEAPAVPILRGERVEMRVDALSSWPGSAPIVSGPAGPRLASWPGGAAAGASPPSWPGGAGVATTPASWPGGAGAATPPASGPGAGGSPGGADAPAAWPGAGGSLTTSPDAAGTPTAWPGASGASPLASWPGGAAGTSDVPSEPPAAAVAGDEPLPLEVSPSAPAEDEALAGGSGEVVLAEGPTPLEEALEAEEPPVELTRLVSSAPETAALGLPQIPLFSDLPKDAFIQLLVRMHMRELRPGDRVITQGEVGSSFFVLASGKVRVVRLEDDGSETVLAHLTDGAFFGEMALLQNGPRTASVIVEEDSQVFEISKHVLDEVVASFPSVERVLRNFYTQRLLSTTMATHALFRPFDPEERRRLMERFKSRPFKAGEVILEEGKRGEGLYLLLTGTLEVSKNRDGAQVVIAELAPGDVFGEMSLLTGKPTNASVTAVSDALILRLSKRNFDELIMTHPQILELVAQVSTDRETENAAIVGAWTPPPESGAALV